MKQDSNLPLIIVCIILIIFLIFTAIYFFSSNSLRDNDTNLKAQNEDLMLYEEVPTEEIIKSSTMEEKVISTYTTNIYDNDKNRVFNIKLACNSLDGTVVPPNEEFSFNNTLGNMGKNEGYKKAIGFDSNGNNIKVYGGGICQLSSTLYNAVLIAKLKVTQRHAHSKRVYYVPKNKDATVFSGGPDFKFINTSNSYITISSKTDGHTVTVSLIQK